ncbi:twin-arginine translocase subunit TatC [Cognatishimia activa]|uniref:Sec-independent protein translocase protein TatC n=1 Tax=Cognatishimia activa TaxID=1715691 RepID=A0A0P1IU13_9RHOB|nr:twin-arginine translocase subunit TatC [Cognatishimia activa]CUJ34773.1 Sec-independent protein translocase protein TatC [Cognatishimia activa]CUK27059.1 Sec-independent protein translocase protein TatC [Cognatishimia activa]
MSQSEHMAEDPMDEVEESSAPLIEHLAELRTRLIHSVVAFIIGMVICFTVATPLFNFLTSPLCQVLGERGQDCDLIFISPQEGFFVAIKISFLGGFILAFPYIGLQMWRFVAPGLYKNERGAFLPFLVASPFMFILGASFAFYVVTPLAYDFFLGFQQFGNEGEALVDEEVQQGLSVVFQGSAQEYLNLTIKFVVAFGLCFQLPVLLTLMGKAGLVNAEGLGNVRKYAVVGILVLAALVTPPDVITQVILFVVVYGLYEVSIFLVGRVEKKREEQLRAEGYYDDEDDLHPEEMMDADTDDTAK